ncbi:MAG TPA: hypothetical protein VFD92_13365 [Candidatus Binatia bacterium]|nr:hypothetical protein [Candidatus Binatia bacterium]
MNPVRDERGIIMVVALGIVAALAGLTLAVATSGQMSTLTAALSTHAANAFYAADGAAYYGLSDINNFVPFMAPRATNLEGGPADLKSTVTANYEAYRALPGNLLIRTVDGNVRPAQFGQNEGLGKMYIFRLDARKNITTAGVDPASTVSMKAARPGPCADCGN